MAKLLQNLNRFYPVNVLLVSANKRHLSVKSKDGCTRKIFNHFSKNGKVSNLDLFPSDLKRVISKKNTPMYVADEEIAQKIAQIISRYHVKTVPFFELYPGPCILSNALLNELNLKTLGLFEKHEDFLDVQMKFKENHGSKVLHKSIRPMWGHYTHLANFILKNSQPRQWHEDIVYQMFSCLQSDDVYRLVRDVTRQQKLFGNGRGEIFAILSSIEYKKLTAGPDSTYWLYTQMSCIFQILFEYKLLAEVPKTSFLPWLSPKMAYGGKVEYDTDLCYLVRIVPRPNLFTMCDRDDLLSLRFFVYQCLFKRKGYLIPKLEKWIPGIGIDLITANFKQQSNSLYQPECSLLAHLPDSFDVFTECGSLTPFQICALFQYFRQSPHYHQSSFHQQCKDFYASKISKTLDVQDLVTDDEDAPTANHVASDAKH